MSSPICASGNRLIGIRFQHGGAIGLDFRAQHLGSRVCHVFVVRLMKIPKHVRVLADNMARFLDLPELMPGPQGWVQLILMGLQILWRIYAMLVRVVKLIQPNGLHLPHDQSWP